MKLKREHLLIAVVLVIGAALVAFSTIRRGPLATAGSRLRVTSMGEEGINKVVSVRLLEAHVHETIEVTRPPRDHRRRAGRPPRPRDIQSVP